MTRALPGKRPLLVPARLRNPQHFHRLCTGLAPLRTSHPHVCAQAAGKQSCRRLAGSSGSARAPVLAGPASAPRASVRDTLVHRPPLAGGTDVRRCRAHVVRRREPDRESACALVSTDIIKVLANHQGISQPETATRCRWLPNSMPFIGCCGHSCVGWGRTLISVRCGPTANRRLFELNLARLVRQAGKRCYRRRPRRR
jgi:hypothetical protein